MRRPTEAASRRAAAEIRAGRAAHLAGDRAEAARRYRAALAEDDAHPEALHGLGALALEAGRAAEAIGLLGRALSGDPANAQFHLVIAIALLAEGHGEAARAAASLATLHAPADAAAHLVHARVLVAIGRPDEAAAAFDRAAALAPADPAIRAERGAFLMARGRPAAALDDFRCADAARPGDPATLANLAAAFQELGRFDEALHAADRAVALAPESPEALSNRALARLACGALEAGLADLERAASLRPGSRPIRRNRAAALYELDRLDEAEAILASLLRETPDDPAAVLNAATIRLARGDFRAGFAGFEARRHLHPLPARAGLPDWNGEALAGPLLLEAEQGIGDTLQFLRFVPLAAARAGAGVHLALPAGLRRLAASLAPWAVAVDPAAPAAPDVAARLPLGSLARMFVADAAAIPPPAPLEVPPPPARGSGAALRVGIAWSGNPLYKQDRRRSIPPDLLAPLLRAEGVRFVSLQEGGTARPDGIAPPPFPLADWADTAAVIASCDLVISVDTAVAHLAGSLGAPTWLLDRAGGDWRWLRGRTDSPWYPSLEIFRQDAPLPPREAWPPVVARVRARLDQAIATLGRDLPEAGSSGEASTSSSASRSWESLRSLVIFSPNTSLT